VLDGVGERVTMLGDTLSTATTSGPLGSVTQEVGNKLVPVIAMVESTTDKVGDATGLGDPLKGIVQKVGDTVEGAGDKVTDAGNGNPLTNTVGGALSNTGTTVGKVGGLVANGSGSGGSGGLGGNGLLETVGGAVVNVGTGLNIGNTNGVVSAVGVNGVAGGNLVASVGGALGGSGIANTGPTAALANVGTIAGGAINPITTGVSGLTQTIGSATGIGAPVASLTGQTGGAVANLGGAIAGSTTNPVVTAVGNTVTTVGGTVAAVGGLVNGGTGTGTSGGLGGVLGGLTGALGGNNR
jgi:hypothetical protein